MKKMILRFNIKIYDFTYSKLLFFQTFQILEMKKDNDTLKVT